MLLLTRLLLCGTLLTQSSCIGVSLVLGRRPVEVGKTIGPSIGKNGFESGGRTTSEALRMWGEPQQKLIKGGREYWLYRSEDLTWRGAEIFAIIPIPLLVPIGHKLIVLEFEHDQLMHYTINHARQRQFGLFLWEGLMFGKDSKNCEGGWGCY
jgi:hypothetical protein